MVLGKTENNDLLISFYFVEQSSYQTVLIMCREYHRLKKNNYDHRRSSVQLYRQHEIKTAPLVARIQTSLPFFSLQYFNRSIEIIIQYSYFILQYYSNHIYCSQEKLTILY